MAEDFRRPIAHLSLQGEGFAANGSPGKSSRGKTVEYEGTNPFAFRESAASCDKTCPNRLGRASTDRAVCAFSGERRVLESTLLRGRRALRTTVQSILPRCVPS